VLTVSNAAIPGATAVSSRAKAVAALGGLVSNSNNGPPPPGFDFGATYGSFGDEYRNGVLPQQRSHALLAAQVASGQPLTVRYMMEALRDHGTSRSDTSLVHTPHYGAPSIDQHDTGSPSSWYTASSIVSDWPAADVSSSAPRLPIVWHSVGPACLGVFLPVFFVGRAPAWLSSEDRARRFRGLSRTAGFDPCRIARVQHAWRPVQEQLYADAHWAAARATAMGAEAGAALLSAFMRNATDAVMQTLDDLEANLTGVATCCVGSRGCPREAGGAGRGNWPTSLQLAGLSVVVLVFAVLNGRRLFGPRQML